jgi:hypothetical protein
MTRAATNALRQLHEIAATIAQLTPAVIADLDRRARYTTTPDGYPTRTINDGSSHGTSELTSVESAANQRATHHDDDDPAGDAIRQLFADIADISRITEHISQRVAYLTNVQYAAGRKPSSGAGICGACRRDVPGTSDDRLRSGYCDSCRKAWERAGRPDRHQFEAERRTDVPTHRDSKDSSAHTECLTIASPPGNLNANVDAVGR